MLEELWAAKHSASFVSPHKPPTSLQLHLINALAGRPPGAATRPTGTLPTPRHTTLWLGLAVGCVPEEVRWAKLPASCVFPHNPQLPPSFN